MAPGAGTYSEDKANAEISHRDTISLAQSIAHMSDEERRAVARTVAAVEGGRRDRLFAGPGAESYGSTSPIGGGASEMPMSTRFLGERLSLENIDEAMRYQPWDRQQQEAGDIVREALTTAAKAILRHVPDAAFRSVALRNILDARMNANAAISFRGRF
jgi:hypothetical protein